MHKGVDIPDKSIPLMRDSTISNAFTYDGYDGYDGLQDSP